MKFTLDKRSLHNRAEMFIKYDEIELMEFFETEPIFIGDEEAGECMYVRRQGDFKIILVISTYEKYIKVSVSYKENVIYSEKHSSISEIEKIDKECFVTLL